MADYDFFEDIGENPENSGNQPANRKDNKKTYLIYGGIAGVILLFLILLLAGGSGNSQKNLDKLATKITTLEKKINSIESWQNDLQSRLKGLDQIERGISELSKRVNTMSKEIKEVKKTASSSYSDLKNRLDNLSSRSSRPPSPQKQSTTQKDAKTHQVKKGENLFRIGLQYGVTAEQIRSWNDLDKNEPIYPGQKLLIRASGNTNNQE